jgi:hypothetical protein
VEQRERYSDSQRQLEEAQFEIAAMKERLARMQSMVREGAPARYPDF